MKNLADDKNFFTLSTGEKLGVKVLEIVKIPKDTVSENNISAYRKISDMFGRLIGSLHRATFTQEFYLDIMMLSEETNGQLYKANITFFIIIRSLSNIQSTISSSMQIFEQILMDSLKVCNYTYKWIDMNNGDFLFKLKQLPKNGYSIIKEDIIEEPSVAITEFYYYVDVFPQNTETSIESLIKVMIQYPNTCVLFQISPTQYAYDEQISIRDAANMLRKLYNGFPDEYYGEIRDYLALESAEIFEYYNKKIGTPIFEYNLAIYSSEIDSVPLISAVSGYIQGSTEENEVRLAYHKIDPDINLYDSFYTLPWNIHDYIANLKYTSTFWKYSGSPDTLKRLGLVISLEETLNFFKLPVSTSDNKLYGITIDIAEEIEQIFEAGVLQNNTNILFGIVQGSNTSSQSIGVDSNDLRKHMFVSGATRSGKTTFILNTLKQLDNKGIPFLILEMVKNEYRPIIDAVTEINIFTPGKHNVSPLIINPFIPPANVKLSIWKSYLITAFKASIDMSGPLEMIFRDTIRDCYAIHNWRDNSTIEDNYVQKFGMFEFVQEFRKRMNRTKYETKIKDNIQQAGEIRLLNLINQDYTIFDNTNTTPIESLINNNTIIELEAIGDIEQKSLIASLILINAIAYIKYNMTGEKKDKLNNIIVLEEAHVLLENKKKTEGASSSAEMATALINSILAEMAAYGFGMIISDQSPQKVPSNVIINTGIKIILRTTDANDKKTLADSSNMSDYCRDQLTTFKNGLGYCFFDKVTTPILFQGYNTYDKYNLRKFIDDDEIAKRNSYWTTGKSDLLIPYSNCRLCKSCVSCNIDIRIESKHIAFRVFNDYVLPHIDNITLKAIAKILANYESYMSIFSIQQLECIEWKKLYFCSLVHFFRILELEFVTERINLDKEQIVNFLQKRA